MRRPEILLLAAETFPSKFREPPTSRGLTWLANSIEAAPDTSSSIEDEEIRSNILNTEAVWAVDREPGSTTRACKDDVACVASAASATDVLVLKSVRAWALIESIAAVFELEDV